VFNFAYAHILENTHVQTKVVISNFQIHVSIFPLQPQVLQ